MGWQANRTTPASQPNHPPKTGACLPEICLSGEEPPEAKPAGGKIHRRQTSPTVPIELRHPAHTGPPATTQLMQISRTPSTQADPMIVSDCVDSGSLHGQRA